ncbi:MAG: glycosyltransferase [Mariprofundaceae bacterium]|nr:glycosyltransferase [Mariprofundaceae bacterium]
MRILYLTDADLAPHKAPQIHVSQFLQNWQKLDCEVLLRAPRTQEAMPAFSFPHVWLPRLDMRLLGDWLWQRSIYKQLKQELKQGRWDVVYTRQMTTFPALYRLCKQAGIPVVCEVNGFLLDNYATGGAPAWKICLVRRMESQMMRDVHLVVVPYAALKLRMVQQYPVLEDKIVIIENGVDAELFVSKDKGQCRSALQLEQNVAYVGFVGSFDFYHDVTTMLDAYAVITQALPDMMIHYLMVGDGVCRAAVQQDVEQRGLEDVVRFVGAVPHAQVVDYINAADVMVSLQPMQRMLELGEASSLKVKEYLACGVPVVLSHPKGMPSSFEDLCAHVQPEHPQEFAEAVIAMLQHGGMAYDANSLRQSLSWASSAARLLAHLKCLECA